MDRRRAAGALLALAVCIASSDAAPTVSNQTGLDLYDAATEGCYYNFQHYGEGDRIMTNEPCLNCTCHNRMLMCYLRVCPFTKPIGQDCTVEKRADQCCPIVTCPDVPVDLLTSTSTTSPAEYGATSVGKLDRYGCSINGKYFPEGSKVPPTPNKPCEHCYCIRNMTTCVMQECTLHVDGCTPIYHKDVCCPVRYSCDHPEDEMLLLDDLTTTVRPTPGFLLTTTTVSPVTQMTQDCIHEDQMVPDGALIKTEKACEHCYCMKGDIVCVVQECGTPMENEGKNCTSQPPREGQCCPDTYICEGDEIPSDLPSDYITHHIELEDLTTSSPPRRVGVEGSGYRNEPDEPYTEMSPLETEIEGSGFEDTTIPTLSDSDKPSPNKQDDTESSTYSIGITGSETSEKQDKDTQITTEQSTSLSDKFTPVKQGDFESTTLPTNTYIEGSSKIPSVESDHTVIPSLSTFEGDTSEKQEFEPTISDADISHEATTQAYKHEQTTEYEKQTQEDDSHQTTSPLIRVTDSDIKQETDILQSTTYSSIDVTDKDVTDNLENEIDRVTKPSVSSISTVGIHEIDNDYTTTIPEEVFEKVTTQKEDDGKEITETPIADITDIKQFTGEHKTTPLPNLEVSDQSSTVQDILDTTHKTTIADMVSSEKQGTEYDQSTNYDQFTEKVTPGKSEMEHDFTTVSGIDSDITDNQSNTPRIDLSVTDSSEKQSLDEESEATEKPVIDHTSTVATPQLEDIEKTTEPDKGLNTVPSGMLDEDLLGPTTGKTDNIMEIEPTTDAAISVGNEYEQEEMKTTISDKAITKTDYISTTQTAVKEEEITTQKRIESVQSSTQASLLVDETTFYLGHSTTESHIADQNEIVDTTNKIIPKDDGYTTSERSDIATEPFLEVTKPLVDIITDSTTQRKGEVFEPTTDKTIIIETTSIDSQENEIDDYARIPGEGDCLSNGITYRNNSEVPKTNNCHTGCKCLSSIVKCDPIICSSPPEYMDNCQPVFDSPDSCCPTYICHTGETLPPQPDSHMSATERPGIPSTIECNGEQCESEDKKSSTPSDKPEIKDCGSISCGEDMSVNIPPSNKSAECSGNTCSPTEICSNGDCPVTHPITECKGQNCAIEPVITPVKDVPLCTDAETCQQISPCEGVKPETSEEILPCVGDTCRRKDAGELDNISPEKCTGSECKQYKPHADTEMNISTESITQMEPEKITETTQEDKYSKIPDKTGITSNDLETQTKSPAVTTTVETQRFETTIKHELSDKMPSLETITTSVTSGPIESVTEYSIPITEVPMSTETSDSATTEKSSITDAPIVNTTSDDVEAKSTVIPDTTKDIDSDSETSTILSVTVSEAVTKHRESLYTTIIPEDIESDTKSQQPSTESQQVSTSSLSEEQANQQTTTEKSHLADIATERPNLMDIEDISTLSPKEQTTVLLEKDKTEHASTESITSEEITTQASATQQIDEEINTSSLSDEHMIERTTETITTEVEMKPVASLTSVMPDIEESSTTLDESSKDVTTEVSDTRTSDVADLDEISHKTTETVDIIKYTESVTEITKDQSLAEQQSTSEKPIVSAEQDESKTNDLSATTGSMVSETSMDVNATEKTSMITEITSQTLDDKSPTTVPGIMITEKQEITDKPEPSVSMVEDLSTSHIEAIVTEQAITLMPEVTDTLESSTHITKQDEFISETSQTTEQQITSRPLSTVTDKTVASEGVNEQVEFTTLKATDATNIPIDSSQINDVSPTEPQITETLGIEEPSTPVNEFVDTKQPVAVTESTVSDIRTTEQTRQTSDSGMLDSETTKLDIDVTKQQEMSQTPAIVSKEESEITEKITATPMITTKPLNQNVMTTYSSEEETEKPSIEDMEKLENTSDHPLSSTEDLSSNTQEPILDMVTETADKETLKPEEHGLETVTEKEKEITDNEIFEATIAPEKILTTQEPHDLSSEDTLGLTDGTKSSTKPVSDHEIPSTIIPVFVTEEEDVVSTEKHEVNIHDLDSTAPPMASSSESSYTQQDVTTEPETAEATEQPEKKPEEETSPTISESHVKVTEQPVTKKYDESSLSTHIPESDTKESQEGVTEMETTNIYQNEDSVTTNESQTPQERITELPLETSTGTPQAIYTDNKESTTKVTTPLADNIANVNEFDSTDRLKEVTSQSLTEPTTIFAPSDKTERVPVTTTKLQDLTTESTLALTTMLSESSTTEAQNIPDNNILEVSTEHESDKPETVTEGAIEITTNLDIEEIKDDNATPSSQDLTTKIIELETAITDVDVSEVVTSSDTTIPKEPQMSSTKLPLVTDTDSLYEKTTELLRESTTKTPLELFTYVTVPKSTPISEQDTSTTFNIEPQSVTGSKHDTTETTPYVVELEEHTHKPVDEISTLLPTDYDIPTEHSQSVTEIILDQSTSPDISVHDVYTTPTVDETFEKSTLTPVSDDKQTPQVTTQISGLIPEKGESIESTSTKPSEEVTYPYVPKQTLGAEIPVQTEKSTITDKVPEITSTHKTGLVPEEIPVTHKSTTPQLEEDITTISSVPKPSEKPIDVVPPMVSSETPKPVLSEIQPTDEIPDDDQFPPSEGTSGYGQEPDYVEEDQAFGPGTCRYGGKVYVSAQQIPRDDPCDFCFCFRSDIICLQQSCPPPIHGCHEEPIQGFCCPRYECPVAMATTLNVTTTTTTTTTTLPPHFLPHAYKGAAQRKGCQIKGHIYKVGEVVRASSGPCLHCTCGGDGQMKCDPKACTPEPMLRQMIAAAVSAKRRR
ncbi:hypothetical protein ACJJTC_004339 [Scirpophaga incertulas]